MPSIWNELPCNSVRPILFLVGLYFPSHLDFGYSKIKKKQKPGVTFYHIIPNILRGLNLPEQGIIITVYFQFGAHALFMAHPFFQLTYGNFCSHYLPTFNHRNSQLFVRDMSWMYVYCNVSCITWFYTATKSSGY